MSDGPTDGIGLLALFLELAARHVDAQEGVGEAPAAAPDSALLERLERLEWVVGVTSEQDVLGPDDPPLKYEAPGPPPEKGPHRLPRTNRCVEAYSAWRQYALELRYLVQDVLAGTVDVDENLEKRFETIENTERIQ